MRCSPGYGGVAINSFKQVLHLAEAAAAYHDVVTISSNLNPWVILKNLAKNLVDYVIEEGRGESKSLSTSGVDLKGL